MKLKQEKIRVEAILTTPVVPKEMVLPNWAKSMKKSVNKIKKSVRNEMMEFQDLLQERADSKRITVVQLLENPVFADMHKREIEMRRKTLEALTKKLPDGSTRFSRGVDDNKKNYERYRREGHYPLYGSNKDKVKGLIYLGLMALTGQDLKEWLKPDHDKIITGEPLYICSLEKLKEFRRSWISLVAEFGWFIIKSDYKPEMLKLGTEKLNRLANQYRLDELAEFEPGGASHVDFIVRTLRTDDVSPEADSLRTDEASPKVGELPDPDNPGTTRKFLALHIQVSNK